MTEWYVAVSGEQQGPMSADDVRAKLASGELSASAHVFSQGMSEWQPVGENELFADAVTASAPPPSPSGDSSDVIDFKIFGEEMQFVEITLDPEEACIAEAGAFMYMDPGIEMETIFGDGSASTESGFMGKLMSAESVF